MRTSPIVLLCLLVSLAVTANSQEGPPNDAFARRFFDDLKLVFGQLQRKDLDIAFQRAKAPQCSDLAGMTEWKHVAYLNDDRSLAAWYFDSIEDVRKDPSKYVFRGNCATEDSSLTLFTSFPVWDAQTRSLVMMRDNDPVTAKFDHRSHSVRFDLPYLYQIRNFGLDASYSLLPPEISSKPKPNVTEWVSCKSMSDPELTYRFLLCRVQLRGRWRSFANQLGANAYYILSDGKEASSTVKLKFGDPVKP